MNKSKYIKMSILALSLIAIATIMLASVDPLIPIGVLIFVMGNSIGERINNNYEVETN